MNLTEQQLKEFQQLLISNPINGVEQADSVLKEFKSQNIQGLTATVKEQWLSLMVTYIVLLQQFIKTTDDLQKALDTIEKAKLLCDKQTTPYNRETLHLTAGKIYMQHVNSFVNPEDARIEAIISFEEAFNTIRINDSFFSWLQVHIYLAEVYLIEGNGKDEHMALALLNRVFPDEILQEKNQEELTAKINTYPFPATVAKAFEKKKALNNIDRYSYPFFNSMLTLGGKHHKNKNYDEAIIFYKASKDIIKKLEGNASPLFRAVTDNLMMVNRIAGNTLDAFVMAGSEEQNILFNSFTLLSDEEIYRVRVEHFVGLFIEAKEHKAASELLFKVLNFCNNIHNNYQILFEYRVKLGYLNLKSNQFTTSLKSYIQATLLFEQYLQNQNLPIAEVYYSIAELLIEYFRFIVPAKYYLAKSFEIQSNKSCFEPLEKAKHYLLFGRFYFASKDFEEAKKYYNLYTSEILHINSKIDNTGSTLLDETLLGELHETRGDFANAEKCYLNTLNRLQSRAEEADKIVLLYLRLGELYDKWDKQGTSSFSVYMKGLNMANTTGAGGYLILAQLHYRYSLYIIRYGTKNNVKLGVELLRASAHKDSMYLAEVFAIGSEEHRSALMNELYEKVFVFISACLYYNIEDTELNNILYNYVLRRKAVNLQIDYLQKIKNKKECTQKFKEVQKNLYKCYDEISMAVITDASDIYINNLVKKTKELLYEKELLVLQELQILDPFYIDQFIKHEDIGSVVMNLPEDSVIIEFVKYKPFQFEKQMQTGNGIRQRYAALVTFSSWLNCKLVDVGDCDEINTLIRNYRSAVISNQSKYNEDDKIIGKQLREGIFDIFLDKIGNRKRIVLAPDGEIAFLPFESLPMEDNRYLIEDYVFSYVNSGRDVISFSRSSVDINSENSVVMGNPEFSVSPDADLLEGGVYFKKLSQTQVEIETIARMLHVPAISKKEVSKEALLNLKNPKFLHLATHGYNVSGSNVINNNDLFFKTMFTNGLCLSGINDYLLSNIESPELGNGFLSAVNVLNMELTLTELVVLSACDAGLGNHADGEGILGLRRAFSIAGVKSIIMSLWKVPDKQTALLMQKFYEELLNGKARVHALRNAQLYIKSQYNSPIYWAGFICSGIPSKLGANSFGLNNEL